MTPTVDVQFPYTRVTCSGLWYFYKAEEGWKSTMRSGAFTTYKHNEVKAHYSNLGHVDSRIGNAVLALASPTPSWTALLAFLSPPHNRRWKGPQPAPAQAVSLALAVHWAPP